MKSLHRPARPGQFIAFEINEFTYRVIAFSVHNDRDQALRAASKNAKRFVNYESPVRDDVTPTVLEVGEKLKAWLLECGYAIDWTIRELRYVRKEKARA